MGFTQEMLNILKGPGTFRGGVHPYEGKELTEARPVEDGPFPSQVILPVSQHIGAPAKPLVNKKDKVARGQPVAEAGGFVSSPVFSPVNGVVKNVAVLNFPAFRPVTSIVIDVEEGSDDWWDGLPESMDPENADPKELIDRIRWAGLVGLGGATFPTHVKLSPPKGKSFELVVINGAECEPYLTSDYRMMLEKSEDIIAGLKIFIRAVGAVGGVIAIEDNKPAAVEKLRNLTDSEANIGVRVMPVKYPQGGEKQLIYALTRREVPSGAAGTADTGILVQNVNTAIAAYEAVTMGRPLTERVVTVTGDAVEKPGNYRMRIGSPMRLLLEHAGLRKGVRHVISGGPMMGLAAGSMEMPIQKGTGGILCLNNYPVFDEAPCIRCGRCVDACPVGLLPQTFSILVESRDFEPLEELNIMDCIECGSCAYSCPSGRNIVAAIRFGKSESVKLARKKKQ